MLHHNAVAAADAQNKNIGNEVWENGSSPAVPYREKVQIHILRKEPSHHKRNNDDQYVQPQAFLFKNNRKEIEGITVKNNGQKRIADEKSVKKIF